MDDTGARHAPPGTRALSRTSRVIVAVVAGVLAAVVTFHLAMVFFHVAPSNVVSREYDDTIDGYVYPEFRQNWKLFAPEPVHVNREVHARALLRDADGTAGTSEWINVTAAEIEATRGHPAPSQTRNQLRKAWRTLLDSLDDDNRPRNAVGEVTAGYIKRVALRRMSAELDIDMIERVQLRAVTTRVPEPAWSERTADLEPDHRVLPWWTVREGDFPEGSTR